MDDFNSTLHVLISYRHQTGGKIEYSQDRHVIPLQLTRTEKYLKKCCIFFEVLLPCIIYDPTLIYAVTSTSKFRVFAMYYQ